MKDKFNRRLPALTHRNAPDTLRKTLPDNINFKALHEKWARDEQEESQ